jgi:hypothetical protein
VSDTIPFHVSLQKRKTGYVVVYDGEVIAKVVPDKTYPGMYRILADGELSDMVNISRATDAAQSIARSILNKRAQPCA